MGPAPASELLEVPIIDAQGFFAVSNTSASLPPKLAEQVAAACSSWGFFQLVNHGVPAELVAAQHAAAKRFFALPLEQKLACKRSADNPRGFFNDELTKQRLDLKEGFDFGHIPWPDLPDDHPANKMDIDGVNRWPAGQDWFKEEMTCYYKEMERISFKLLELFCAGLGLPPHALHHLFQPTHSSFLRLNYYPLQPPAAVELALGISPHKDAGFLTVLVQDEVPGLQVLKDGRWHTVPPEKDAFVINVGDMAQVLTNDTYRAPLHRVVSPTAASTRYSAPFFLNPSYTADCAPLDVCTSRDRPPAYRTVNWGEFRAKRFAGDFADAGEEVQIEHYRLLPPVRGGS